MRYSFESDIWEARFGYFYMWSLRDYGRRVKWRIGWAKTFDSAERRCDKSADRLLNYE
jgi:hypothetical protein